MRLGVDDLSRADVAELINHQRPAVRGDCEMGGINESRPCVRVSCKWNLYLDVNPITGSIKFNFPDVEPSEMVDSCSLDVAERGGVTLEVLGAAYNITRERARQVEAKAVVQLKAAGISMRIFSLDDEVIPNGRATKDPDQ
jgi:hypothetical protein